jgi:hypothetical protein
VFLFFSPNSDVEILTTNVISGDRELGRKLGLSELIRVETLMNGNGVLTKETPEN